MQQKAFLALFGITLASLPTAAKSDAMCRADDIRIASNADILSLVEDRAPSALREWSRQRESLLQGALDNFKQSMQEAPDPAAARVTGVLSGVLEEWITETIKGATGSVVPTLAQDLFPGPLGAGAELAFGFHAKLEEKLAKAKQTRAQLALVDWIVNLNSLISDTYGALPEVSEVRGRLWDSFEEEHGELDERPTDEQIAWAANLCASILEVEASSPGMSTEEAEVALYEAWIRNSKDDLAQASCIELNYDAEADGETLSLSQTAGRVRVPAFGPQLVRRLDQLIAKDVVGQVDDLAVPLCICIKGLPGLLVGPSCQILSAEHKFLRSTGDAKALSRIPNESYWREETDYVNPFEEE